MLAIKKRCLIVMIIMAILSFSNLLGRQIAGISVFIGIAFFFINKAFEGQTLGNTGLDIKLVGIKLKEKTIFIWIVMPLIMDALSMSLGKHFIPGYIDHIITRSESFISFNNLLIMIIQLAVLALGEEIAWRAFFQKQLTKVLPIAPVLIISSLFFAFGHLNKGTVIVVAYDIFFVFINSILYGVIFHKTNNAWISWISHFAANLFSVIVLIFMC